MSKITCDFKCIVAVKYFPGGNLTWHGGMLWEVEVEVEAAEAEQASMVDWIGSVS